MSDKHTIAAQLLRAVNQQEIELSEERAAHLATRQELSMALAERAHARAEVERLREALEGMLSLDSSCGCGVCEATHKQARAALAGQPRET